TTSLRKRLAENLGVAEDNLIIGNGSNELLQLVISLALPRNSRILIVTPTFAIYEHLIHIAELDPVKLNLDGDFNFPIDDILAALDKEKIALCLLCSPNSPTGGILSEEELVEILKHAQGLVLLDEAYHEFSGMNYLPLQQTFKNLLVSRTFSKAIGLAGLRVGYLVGSRPVIAQIIKAKLPYNVNIFSEFVATRLLQKSDLLQTNIDSILAEKANLHKKLDAIEALTVYPSRANFFMIESTLPADDLFEKLVEKKILIRNISTYHPLLANKLRITVGSPAENDRLIESLHHILG
ncbi:MAG: pyridoxal phosphate-dependent aminotransferase, partial [bacterium]